MESYCILILRSTIRVVRGVHADKTLAVDPSRSTGIAGQSACFTSGEYLLPISSSDGAGVLLCGLATVGVEGIAYLNVLWFYNLVSRVDVFSCGSGVIEGDFCPVLTACVRVVAVEGSKLLVGVVVVHGVAGLATVSCGVGGSGLYVADGAGNPVLVAYAVALVDGARPGRGGGEGDSGCCGSCCGE